jgi:hypothetical protein
VLEEDPFVAKLKAAAGDGAGPCSDAANGRSKRVVAEQAGSGSAKGGSARGGGTDREGRSPPARAKVAAVSAGRGVGASPGLEEHSYDALKAGCPEGVKPHMKEKHLADATFEQIFGMNKEAFAALPVWKQQRAKKKVGLF